MRNNIALALVIIAAICFTGNVVLADTPTNTPTRTPTHTPTSTPTRTPTNTFTKTKTPIPGRTATNTPTQTFTPSKTPTRTSTPTSTPTKTGTSTATPLKTGTSTPTQTSTKTPTPSKTPTSTPTVNTATSTPTKTPTGTPTSTPTQTPTPCLTPWSVAIHPTPIVGVNPEGTPYAPPIVYGDAVRFTWVDDWAVYNYDEGSPYVVAGTVALAQIGGVGDCASYAIKQRISYADYLADVNMAVNARTFIYDWSLAPDRACTSSIFTVYLTPGNDGCGTSANGDGFTCFGSPFKGISWSESISFVTPTPTNTPTQTPTKTPTPTPTNTPTTVPTCPP